MATLDLGGREDEAAIRPITQAASVAQPPAEGAAIVGHPTGVALPSRCVGECQARGSLYGEGLGGMGTCSVADMALGSEAPKKSFPNIIPCSPCVPWLIFLLFVIARGFTLQHVRRDHALLRW